MNDDTGSKFLKEIQGLRAHDICRLGMARTFQTTVAFNSQTVLTNVLVGSTFGRSGEYPTLWFNEEARARATRRRRARDEATRGAAG